LNYCRLTFAQQDIIMKKSKLLFIIFIFTGYFTAKAQDTTTYTNKKFHFYISLPSNWTENKADEKGNKSFVGVSPAESSDDSFFENVIVSTTPNIDQNLKSYFKDRVNRIKFSVKEFHHEGEGDEEINLLKAKFVIYTFDYNGVTMEMIAYIFVKNKTAFVITGSALQSTFDSYKDKFQDIARSFKVEDIKH